MTKVAHPSSHNEQKIDAIRELLFGQQTAELTALIQTTEKSLRINQLRLEDRVVERLDCLNRELKSANDRLGSLERNFQKEAENSEKFAEEIHCRNIITKNKIVRVEDSLKHLETQIDSDFKKLAVSIKAALETLTEQMETGLSEVGNQSTARSQLGELLIEMGVTIQAKDVEHQRSGNDRETVLAR